ncbi:MarR family winged helix-turn-helix transcriptional regulator [Roseateles sp.]|uniref:MarR family winged helix-turn-helix transcriptional regulator n=1 Tax=Roseateles sp. TaxID=1971397 RepID=UPI0039EC0C64
MNSIGSRDPKTPTVSPRGCSSLKIRQLSRRVSQHFDAVVASVDLKTTQYSLLSHIIRMAPVRPGQLASAMEMDASTLTRNLQPLMAQGWVRVGPGDDGRSRQVEVTEAGLAKHALAKRAWRRAQETFNDRLGNDLVQRLHDVLDECLAAMHDKGSVGE